MILNSNSEIHTGAGARARGRNIMSRNGNTGGYRVLGLILALAVAFFAAGVAGASAQERPVVIPNSFIVQVAENEDPRGVARAVAAITRGQIRHVYSNAVNGFSIDVPPGIVIANIVAAHGGVLSVEPNLTAYASLPIVTGVDRIDADLNPVAAIDGTDGTVADGQRVDVDVAIIDTGIDLQHSDLNVVQGVNCIGGGGCSAGGDDDHWHGTHVAGTVGALDDGVDLPGLSAGDVEVVGVAPGARLWAVKVLGSNASGSFDDVIAGVDYVNANAGQIEVANMSLGGIGFLSALRTAIANTVAKGVVFVVAAGNEDRDVYGPDGELDTAPKSEPLRCLLRGKGCLGDSIPASYPEVLTVSAIGDSDGQDGGVGGNTGDGADDSFASFSNYSTAVDASNPVSSPGAAIDLAGPGVDITSSVPLELFGEPAYGVADGTSMASPHVAGAVALYIAEDPVNRNPNNAADVAAIRQALIDTGLNTFTGDPDNNPEPLVNAAGDGGPPPVVNDTPVVVITSPADGATFGTGASISFAGSATDTEDLDLTAILSWSSDKDGALGTGGSFLKVLSDGTHKITASATDSGSKTGSASVTITVGDPPPVGTVVDVVDITHVVTGNKKKKLSVRVNLLDDLGDPVAGASVSIRSALVGSTRVWTGTGTTSGDGSVTFNLVRAPADSGNCYDTSVTAIVSDLDEPALPIVEPTWCVP
jgi:subtilisin family serine protease